MFHQHKSEWIKAEQEEIKSLNENYTCNSVKLHKGKRVLKNKWIYRLKTKTNSQQWHKARLVVMGFGHKKGIDFEEIFSTVVKMSSIRVILELTGSLNLEIA